MHNAGMDENALYKNRQFQTEPYQGSINVTEGIGFNNSIGVGNHYWYQS